MTLGTLFRAPGPPGRYWLAGALCAVLPDVDVVAFWLGFPWRHVLGHRGITHSLAFAAALAAVVGGVAFRGREWDGRRGALWLFLFLATASHGVLDAMTDGGPGVAFFAPFDNARYLLPWRPIPVSPLSVRQFFGKRGVTIMVAEARWICLPAALLAGACAWVRARRRRP